MNNRIKKPVWFLDDNRFESQPLIDRLVANGYDVVPFGDPLDFEDELRHKHDTDDAPCLIVTDLMMRTSRQHSVDDSILVGEQLCQLIRELYGERLPVLVVTAVLDEKVHKRVLYFASELYAKPIDGHKLVEWVREHLR